MKRHITGWLIALSICTAPALAHSAKDRIQASMRVSGTITVSPQGAVATYTIDKPDKLPKPVVKLLGKNIPLWRFQPVRRDGHPVRAKATMHVRVVARPVAGNRYNISIAGSWFGNGHPSSSQDINVRHRVRPYYPRAAVHARVSGTVYLLVQVDRQGRVDHLIARQVDLRIKGMPSQMRGWRHLLAKSAMRAVRDWTFNIPTSGRQAHKDQWVVRIPVDYRLHGIGIPAAPGYGQWDTYVPGPLNSAPWLKPADMDGDIDALPAGGAYLAAQGLHRIVPPNG